MIYNFNDDFCNLKTTVYLYSEYTDKDGVFRQVPLCHAMRDDVCIANILFGNKLDFVFKNSKYGKTIKDVTIKARTHAHGSVEYNDIKMRMPGFTWAGTVKTTTEVDDDNQMYEKRCRRGNDNMIPNGLVCVEFDDVETSKISELINQAMMKFPHLVYAGRTLSNKLFCMHRADDSLTAQNYIRYYKELAVLYHTELGIECDTGCQDIARCRYVCYQFGGRAKTSYCDFSPSDNIEIEYDKIFNKSEQTSIKRVSEYKPQADEKIYVYDEKLGFYYGHGKNHMMQVNDLIVPVPSITQMINTLIALGKTRTEIDELWRTKLKYYNYTTSSRSLTDVLSLTRKFKHEGDYTVGEQTYLFLQMFFPDVVGMKSFFLARNEFLCDRYFDFTERAIDANKRLLIHGDTGIGKTYFANRLGEKRNVIVVVPYIVHMDNYSTFECIDNVNEVKEKISSCVVIWDRFVKLYNRNLIDENSIIIIDESHKLFLDQTYRAAAIHMRRLLKDIKNTVCYVSATPINEIDVDKTLRFEKDRRAVNVEHVKIVDDEDVDFKPNSLIINAILHLIYGNINYYDHIFIASDLYAQKIFDRIYGKYDCQLVRASMKDSDEFRELLAEQALKHKIVVGTCVSYEALNFNNRNERILTISDMNSNMTSHIITQIAGRVRFSYNKVFLIDLVQRISKTDYKAVAEYYDRIREIKSHYNLFSLNHYVQQHRDEVDEVEQWYFENNDIEKIKQETPYYIRWTESEMASHVLSDKSPLNECVRDYIIEHVTKYNDDFNEVDVVINDDCIEAQFFEQNFISLSETGETAYIIREKIHEQQYEYNKLNTYVTYSKINNMIVCSRTMPKAVDSTIKRIIDIIKMKQDDYDNYIDELEAYHKTISYTLLFNILDRRIKEIKRYRKQYLLCYDADEITMYNNVFDVFADKRVMLYNKKINNGKKTKQVKVTADFKRCEKYHLHVEDVFDSCQALADTAGVAAQRISDWIRKGWISKI